MGKLRLMVDLEVNEDVYPYEKGDVTERDWFFNDVLKDELILHSNLVGDEVGRITVQAILT